MEMLEDAKKHQFDLVVTREVCRFARNTVMRWVCVRQLAAMGIEVYFVNDNIWTLDGRRRVAADHYGDHGTRGEPKRSVNALEPDSV